MMNNINATVVVVHEGRRYVLTENGVTRVVTTPTMGDYLAAKRSRRS